MDYRKIICSVSLSFWEMVTKNISSKIWQSYRFILHETKSIERQEEVSWQTIRLIRKRNSLHISKGKFYVKKNCFFSVWIRAVACRLITSYQNFLSILQTPILVIVSSRRRLSQYAFWRVLYSSANDTKNGTLFLHLIELWMECLSSKPTHDPKTFRISHFSYVKLLFEMFFKRKILKWQFSLHFHT